MKIMTIRSGSNANCTYINNGNYGILIDAGVGIRTVQAALRGIDTDLSHIAAIFITHEHIDHIRGLVSITKKYRIPIFANAFTCDAICDRLPDLSANLLVELPTGRDAVCPDLRVTSHDAVESVGYVVTDGKKRFAVATDLGVVTPTVLEHIRCCDTVLLESNYDERMLRNGPYAPSLKQRILSSHGHLSNVDCGVTAAALVEGGTKRLILGHLSENNNLPMLAYNTTLEELEKHKIAVGRDVALSVASRETCSDYVEV